MRSPSPSSSPGADHAGIERLDRPIEQWFDARRSQDVTGFMTVLAIVFRPVGMPLIVAITFAAWLPVAALIGAGSASEKRWIRSLAAVATAVAYVALTSLTVARGSSSDSASSTRHASASILHLPGGQAPLAVVGLIGVGVGSVAEGIAVVVVGVLFGVAALTSRFARL